MVVGVSDETRPETPAEDKQLARAQAVLSACGVDGVATGVQRLRGQSHISWRVDRGDSTPVALRMEPQRGILPPYDLRSEARLLKLLAEVDIPVPKVLGLCVDPDELHRAEDGKRDCLVLEWVEGALLNEGQLSTEAAVAYTEILRRTHTLDWRAAGLDWLPVASDGGPAIRERAEIAERLRSFGVENAPHIRRLREALEGRAPSQTPPMLVHGDVNFGNVILCPRGRSDEAPEVAAALDWEQTHLGDPLSDWGRLIAEDLLGNLDLSAGARVEMREALKRYQRPVDDVHYWALHQLYKHSSATGALSALRGWDLEQIGKMYAEPTDLLLSGSPLEPFRMDGLERGLA